MIEKIVGPSVVSVDTRDVLNGTLFPEEEAVVANAVAKRRQEYTTARLCARRAMARLGLPASPVLSGLRGEPLWPSGVVGSITHCAGYRGAVLGRLSDAASIGIDAEPNTHLTEGVLDAISLAGERVWIRDLAVRAPDVCWDRLLFSAKEAVYKAWFPLVRSWLDFDDALITVDHVTGTFTARLLVPGPTLRGFAVIGFTGRWMVQDGLILTAIVVGTGDGTRRPAGLLG
ncbi:4'-phosphopantetheinyl transferase family protein [Streptosporangium saharense]|uniref:4'-phosphopantetheinyl transferase EntD n=1 Tax=Streptosporangium saharense TaxID=1706840 RepID=A0A7W7VQR7_9ACTN|nr:4'-phosphopantetheinyl transferase superfamily protein [Streptosporangium saharense]MBB4919003.1 4'-phosphopantetheinyl transferase EntD [Streptosporangium saharense]